MAHRRNNNPISVEELTPLPTPEGTTLEIDTEALVQAMTQRVVEEPSYLEAADITSRFDEPGSVSIDLDQFQRIMGSKDYNSFSTYAYNDDMRDLQEYRELENDFKIKLTTLYKALLRGFRSNKGSYCPPEDIGVDFQAQCLTYESEESGKEVYYFKDFGITWSL